MARVKLNMVPVLSVYLHHFTNLISSFRPGRHRLDRYSLGQVIYILLLILINLNTHIWRINIRRKNRLKKRIKNLKLFMEKCF